MDRERDARGRQRDRNRFRPGQAPQRRGHFRGADFGRHRPPGPDVRRPRRALAARRRWRRGDLRPRRRGHDRHGRLSAEPVRLSAAQRQADHAPATRCDLSARRVRDARPIPGPGHHRVHRFLGPGWPNHPVRRNRRHGRVVDDGRSGRLHRRASRAPERDHADAYARVHAADDVSRHPDAAHHVSRTARRRARARRQHRARTRRADPRRRLVQRPRQLHADLRHGERRPGAAPPERLCAGAGRGDRSARRTRAQVHRRRDSRDLSRSRYHQGLRARARRGGQDASDAWPR